MNKRNAIKAVKMQAKFLLSLHFVKSDLSFSIIRDWRENWLNIDDTIAN